MNDPTRRRPRRRRSRAKPRETLPRTLEAAQKVAKEQFGVEALYPEQEEAISALLEGKDTLVVLPTGYGKSLIYQVPAMLLERPVIVASPPIALMRD